ncbi:OmpC Outer membrane protein (porin) [Methylophilaceae bacterium]
MNNTIKLAVASALLAAASSASAAGGIVAGDWTLDIGGIVNAYYTSTKFSGATAGATGPLGQAAGSTASNANITTGLLPNYLSVSGKTRQNDLDVAFTISIQPGASTTAGGLQGTAGNQENRQAYLTFGDASWGSVKLGKDIGVYASDAILNDMTLLGVGSGAGSLAGNTTTLGRIGTGFMYADWKAQAVYSTPNFNGLSASFGVTQAFNAVSYMNLLAGGTTITSATSSQRGGNEPAFEGKVSYDFAADAVKGKVWASGISQKVQGLSNAVVAGQTFTALGVAVPVPAVANSVVGTATATAWDIGTNVNAAGFGLTAYYGEGNGIGQTIQLADGFDSTGNARDSKQYYVQGTYALPGVGTKLGLSYGESKLDANTADTTFSNIKDQMWVGGVYHPITKHLNLVAEYAVSERKVADGSAAGDSSESAKAKTVSLGAILFF